jgi:hypothetical protein
MLWGYFLVKCEVVGPGVKPLIGAWIVCSRNLGFLLHESSYEALQWLLVSLLATKEI